MRKYYFAGRFSSNKLLRERRDEFLEQLPSAEVTSRWIDLASGRGEYSDTQLDLLYHQHAYSKFALEDLADIDAADSLLLFTMGGRGGRHIEFGYALAKNKRLVVIGEIENIFHTLPIVEIYPDWASFLAHEVNQGNYIY